MSEAEPLSADEKALAMTFAYTALVKCLIESGNLDHDHLMSNLGGAQLRLDALGEDGAARALRLLNESLLGLA